ncbi:MAG: helix-turn-helix domain-containing protein [Moorea sp. SIO1F2]|nr:helix-turn-helix domain-containing protein [Moorena sp. SIO1F2]
MIWLLAQGKKTEEVVQITGYSRIWIYALIKRYNQLGAEGLGDWPKATLRERRKQNQGAKPLIGDFEQAQLWQVLQRTCSRWGILEWSKSGRLVNICDGQVHQQTKRMGDTTTNDLMVEGSFTCSY